MRNNFSLLTHKGRWLLATLTLLFTFGIGQMWADETINLYYGSSKSVDGNNLNTEDFFFSGHTSNTGKSAVTIGGTSFTHYMTMSGYGASAINSDPSKLILYYPKKSTTTFTVYVQNKYNGNKKYYIDHLFEGETSVASGRKYEKQLSKDATEKYEYTFTNTDKKNAVIALMPSQTMYIYQISVTESGDDLKQAGDNGYTFGTYRAGVLQEALVNVDGLEIKPSSKLNVGSTYFKIKQSSTYAKFYLPQKTLVTVGVNNSRKFIFCAAATPTAAEKSDANKIGSGSAGTFSKALAEGTWYLESESTSELQISSISFSIPKVTYNANGGSETMSATEWIVADNGFDAPTGKKFDKWNTQANGEGDDVSVGTEVNANTTLYAIWKDDVAEYTVTYKDGESTLKSVNVAVGYAPDTYSPTKDFYTFAAWQKDAVDYDPADLASDASANDEITLTARWTTQYTSGTYEFTGHLTMGTDPQMTIANSTDGSNYDAGRIDNIYVSAQKIGYEATGDYGGWKLKTTNGTLRFMVENTCGIRVTIGEANPLRISYTEGGIVKSADIAKSTTSAVYKADANSLVTLTNFTGSNKTVTLKKIEILPLYNATFTDETGDADGSENNVAEVTLPTPTETTVGTSTFTGWTANKVVYDGETAKAVGAALEAGKAYKLTDITVFTAQWAAVTDFDVKFFPGYEPNTQIGETQSISTGNYATAPADPSREGYNFKGWSYDATEENIVNVAEYAITVATSFTAIWKQVFAVTFDGAGSVNVESGSKVASPNSPSQAGKVFQGWYNGENKWNFADNVTAAMALTSKWEDANANHFYYNYKDAFHYDGFTYKTPEGKVDNKDGESNKAITTPYTLFSGSEGITSVVATKAIYDSKSNWVNAYLKINTSEDSYLTFTIKDGYTAVLKMKMGGYSSDPTITLKKGEETIAATSGTPGGKQASKENDFNEIVYDLVAGTYTMTTATKTLYISHIDLEATALPTFTVTYVPGEGTGDEVVDNDATMVADCPAGFTAPTGKAFNGWKDGDNNDVEVGATVTESMTLTAQWINQYAVTFVMQGHGSTIATQYIKHGAKATKPADPFVMGWDFGGWFTEATCENEFDFNTAIEAATPLFAKWTEFNGCTMLYPAKSGDAIAVGDPIVMQDGSFGGAMSALAIPDGGALNYTNSGLAFATKTGVKANVVLSNDIVAGTKIILTLVAGGDKTRGLFIYTKDGAKINDFTCWVDGVNPASNGLEDTFTYTVQAGDGLEGTNEFQLWRNNTVYLKSLKVSSCGDAIIYHDLTSEVNIAGKGTVTLGANTVREGHTTTATYSDIDPLYEFVSWEVSGTGASIEDASANPATITMGTEDAVVTLNLQLKPVKFTVNYYEGTTLKGTEEVNVNEYPTAAGIETTKAHYIFEGWAESPTATAADVIDLATLTSAVAATFNLYAIYTHVPCVTEGTVFSMSITDPEGTEYNENNAFGVEIGATYVGGKAYSGSKSATKRIGYIDANGEYAFANNGDVTVKIAMDCALAEGDVILFTNSNNRQLKIQKVAGTDLYTTANKKFAIPAASPLIGEYDFYLERGNSESTFKTLRVERPYTISFDLQGHGDAIAAVKQIKGEKISAPAAPTADGWDFGGWYKEAACTNAWDFDNDVVDGTATLFAKWSEHVYNDATLKSLKYGTTAIALEDGIYEYNINLPALTTAVPALDAETNSALATKLITNAAAFDGEGHATSTVKVTSEDLTVELTYTVNFTKAAAVTLQDVTGSITWDFANAVSGTVNVTSTPQVLANFGGVTNDATFESDKLEASGEKFTAGSKANLRANYIRFHTTVPGKLSISYSNTGGNAARFIYVNGVKYDNEGSANTTPKGIDTKVFVPAGDVELVMKDGEDVSRNVQIYQMIFNATPDYSRNVSNNIGTLCVDHNVPAGQYLGATFYQIASRNELYDYKIDFEEVLPNEELKAGEPYIFQSTTGRIDLFFGETVKTTPVVVRGMHGWFSNTEDEFTMLDITEENKKDILYISGNKLYNCADLVGTGLKVMNNRAYIVMSDVPTYAEYQEDQQNSNSAPRRRVTLGKDAEQIATGIENLNASDKPMKLMINGQIFILRGEKLFDATGRLVK